MRPCELSEPRCRHKACRRAARRLQQTDREGVRVGRLLLVVRRAHLRRCQTPVQHQKRDQGWLKCAARACCVLSGGSRFQRRHRQLRSKAPATSGPRMQRNRRSDLPGQRDCGRKKEHAPRRRPPEQLQLSTSEGERARQTCRPGREKAVVSLDTISAYQYQRMSAREPHMKRTHPCRDSARQRARRVAFPVHRPRCAHIAMTPGSAPVILRSTR